MASLVLFKNNLRFNDNDVLFEAASSNEAIIPVYILDEINTKKTLGASSKYWLHHSLNSLNKKLNNTLQCYSGETILIIKNLLEQYPITTIYCEKAFLKNDSFL